MVLLCGLPSASLCSPIRAIVRHKFDFSKRRYILLSRRATPEPVLITLRPSIGSFFSSIALIALIAIPCSAYNFQTIDFPGSDATSVDSIDGNKIVGNYMLGGVQHGFIYDGTTYETFDFPGFDSAVTAIEGDRVAGYYWEGYRSRGYVYDNGQFEVIDHPLTSDLYNGSAVLGMSGQYVVGSYMDENSKTYGYVFDGQSYMNIEPLFSDGLQHLATDISGSRIVGHSGGSGPGYLYDGTAVTAIDVPGPGTTFPMGVSATHVVGYYFAPFSSEYGFIFDGSKYTTISAPSELGRGTVLHDISGNKAVGQYFNQADKIVGLVVTIPEPSTAIQLATAIIGVGGLRLVRFKAQQPRSTV